METKGEVGRVFLLSPFLGGLPPRSFVLAQRQRIKVKAMRELGSQVEKGKKKWENGCSFLVFVFFVVFSFGFDEKM